MIGNESALTRRLCLGSALGLLMTAPSHAGNSGLPMPTSLPDELTMALKKKMPLVVMVSLENCPFCKVARNSYLIPMLNQGVPIVQIDMRNHQALVDLSGVKQTQDRVTRQWRIKVAPTVLFFGPGGAEVAERLVGGYIPDFYGTYLDDRIRLARAAVAS